MWLVLCCKGPFTRSDSWVRRLDAGFRGSDFTLTFLLASFVFQEECRKKIEHALFPSGFFFKITDPCVGKSFLLCSHDPIFGTNKDRILEIGLCDWALRLWPSLTTGITNALVLQIGQSKLDASHSWRVTPPQSSLLRPESFANAGVGCFQKCNVHVGIKSLIHCYHGN